MRWATYVSPTDGAEHNGLLHEGALRGLPGPGGLVDLLGDDGERRTAAAEQARRHPFEVVPEAQAQFRAPVPRPPSVRDFMAFEEHVKNSSAALGHDVNPVWYEQPVFYFTNPANVRGPYEDVPIAPGCAAWDYEMEIAAVIGKGGSDLDPATAEQHIAGYVVVKDWSARDLQKREMKGNLGPAKAKDTATSLSAYLVAADELEPYRAHNAFTCA